MDKITQLEILARALLGGLVELHGREHAACILTRMAEGLRAGLPLDGQCRCEPTPSSRQTSAPVDPGTN
jgi:hypothetical protein